MLRVEYEGRIDADMMRCRIWFTPRPGFEIRIVVPVKASYDEVPEPERVTDPPNDLNLMEAPRLPWDVKVRALAAAGSFAGEFARTVDELPTNGG